MRLVAADAHGRRRRYAHHVRRRAVESRARDRGCGGEARPSLRPRRQRRATGAADGNALLASCSAPRSRYVAVARGRDARDGSRGGRSCAAGRRAVCHPARRVHAARCGGIRHAVTELLEADSAARRHRPRLVVRRHAGGSGRGLRAGGCAHASHRHQRRRAGGGADDDVRRILAGLDRALGTSDGTLARPTRDRRRRRLRRRGYGVPTPESTRSPRSLPRAPRHFSSIRPTRPRRWPGSSRASARGAFATPDGAVLAHRRAGRALRVRGTVKADRRDS